MRDVMREIFDPQERNPGDEPAEYPEKIEHVGLLYDVLAPTAINGESDRLGKIPNDDKDWFFRRLESTTIASDYNTAFKTWKQALECYTNRDAITRTVEITSTRRLLIGHGNPAPSEVGLTVHHTWGAPLIPGSALKGLLSHYLQSSFGPDLPEKKTERQHPLCPKHSDRERAIIQGPTYVGSRIAHGPGPLHRRVFGAPDATSDEKMRKQGHGALVGAVRGEIIFHDAWYIPSGEKKEFPFVADVLTPHQLTYSKNEIDSPIEYDDPKPLPFLAVRPCSSFLLALTGPSDLVDDALIHLLDALTEWGIGGKTVAGYGRFDGEKEKNTIVKRIEEAAEQVRLQKMSPVQRLIEHVTSEKNPDPALRNWKGIYQLLVKKQDIPGADEILDSMSDADRNAAAKELKQLMLDANEWVPDDPAADKNRKVGKKTIEKYQKTRNVMELIEE